MLSDFFFSGPIRWCANQLWSQVETGASAEGSITLGQGAPTWEADNFGEASNIRRTVFPLRPIWSSGGR